MVTVGSSSHRSTNGVHIIYSVYPKSDLFQAVFWWQYFVVIDFLYTHIQQMDLYRLFRGKVFITVWRFGSTQVTQQTGKLLIYLFIRLFKSIYLLVKVNSLIDCSSGSFLGGVCKVLVKVT